MPIRNFFNNLTQRDIPELNITMMGPRSVGKTTVLTSIFFETRDSIAGSKVGMKLGQSGGGPTLISYHTALVDAVTQQRANNLPASSTENEFQFELYYTGRSEPNVKINVRDFPGEYLTDPDKEKNKKVFNYIADSSIILIAIDTPFLMEADGKYNMEKNKVDVVTKYFQDNPEAVKNKMVLFVPLKCERYEHDDRLDEVAQKVRDTYAALISFFKKNNIASFVTPILTLGGIELDYMTSGINQLGETTGMAVYRMYGKDPEYSPMYCPQPLYYLLSYVSNYNDWMKQNKKLSIWEKIKFSLFANIYKDDEFATEIRTLSSFMMMGECGYEMITSNSILKIH